MKICHRNKIRLIKFLALIKNTSDINILRVLESKDLFFVISGFFKSSYSPLQDNLYTCTKGKWCNYIENRHLCCLEYTLKYSCIGIPIDKLLSSKWTEGKKLYYENYLFFKTITFDPIGNLHQILALNNTIKKYNNNNKINIYILKRYIDIYSIYNNAPFNLFFRILKKLSSYVKFINDKELNNYFLEKTKVYHKKIDKLFCSNIITN